MTTPDKKSGIKNGKDYYNNFDLAEERRRTSPFNNANNHHPDYLDLPFQFEENEGEFQLEIPENNDKNQSIIQKQSSLNNLINQFSQASLAQSTQNYSILFYHLFLPCIISIIQMQIRMEFNLQAITYHQTSSFEQTKSTQLKFMKETLFQRVLITGSYKLMAIRMAANSTKKHLTEQPHSTITSTGPRSLMRVNRINSQIVSFYKETNKITYKPQWKTLISRSMFKMKLSYTNQNEHNSHFTHQQQDDQNKSEMFSDNAKTLTSDFAMMYLQPIGKQSSGTLQNNTIQQIDYEQMRSQHTGKSQNTQHLSQQYLRANQSQPFINMSDQIRLHKIAEPEEWLDCFKQFEYREQL